MHSSTGPETSWGDAQRQGQDEYRKALSRGQASSSPPVVSDQQQQVSVTKSPEATVERIKSSEHASGEIKSSSTTLSPQISAGAPHITSSNASENGHDGLSDEYTTPSFVDESPFDRFGPMLSLNDTTEADDIHPAENKDDIVPFPSLNEDFYSIPSNQNLINKNTSNPGGQISVSYQHGNTHQSIKMFSQETSQQFSSSTRAVSSSVAQNPPSTWAETPSHSQTVKRTGINPEQREKVNQTIVPSLQDQELERQRAATSAQVTQWLQGTKTDEEALNEQQIQKSGPSTAKEGIGSENTDSLGINQAENQNFVSNIPGPGVLVHEEDEFWYEEEDDASELDDTTPPATPRRLNAFPLNTAFAPSSGLDKQTVKKPWVDSPLDENGPGMVGQPMSSMAAIVRFEQQSRDIETASRTATIASSRRRSETDLDSLFSAAGVSIRVPQAPQAPQPRHSEGGERRLSLLNRMMPKRSNSNLRKRKESKMYESSSPPPSSTATRESQGPFPSLRRMSSRSRSKSPQPPSQPNSPPLPTSAGLSPPGAWTSMTNVIRRSRSKSELSTKGGIADIWASQGGPPLLKPPAHNIEDQEPIPPDFPTEVPPPIEHKEDDEASATESVEMPITSSVEDIMPTHEGFKAHVQRINSGRLDRYLVDRITKEQLTRYKKLAEDKIKHAERAKRFTCPAGERCCINGTPKELPPRTSNRTVEAPIAFHVPLSNSRETQDPSKQGSTVPATFPEGVPLPPVGQLPAQFECPYCFKVKEFSKPSDWTKHVHEDLQPFTCTFPNCQEPKSFKRKADWVRHENERHRHLERWECNYPDCQHVCYRRDNFVHHLEREHKLPEPRVRTNRTTRGPSALSEENGIVAMLVEKCRHETMKRAKEEPCRFCGNYLATWKKLTVHLAKHLEQISLPVLGLVNQLNPEQDSLPVIPDFENEYINQQQETIEMDPNDMAGRRRFDGSVPNVRDQSTSGVDSPEEHNWKFGDGSFKNAGDPGAGPAMEHIPFNSNMHLQAGQVSPYGTNMENFYAYQYSGNDSSPSYDVSRVSPLGSSGEVSVHHTPQPPSTGFEDSMATTNHVQYEEYRDRRYPATYPYAAIQHPSARLLANNPISQHNQQMQYPITTSLPQTSEGDFAYQTSPLAFNTPDLSNPYSQPHSLQYPHLASQHSDAFGSQVSSNYQGDPGQYIQDQSSQQNLSQHRASTGSAPFQGYNPAQPSPFGYYMQ